MTIQNLFIGQKVMNKDNTQITIAEIHKDGTIIDTDNNIHNIDNLSLIKDEPYLNVDSYGHISLCIDSPAGTLLADIDRPIDVGYTAMYISLLPDKADEQIDVVSVRNTSSEKHPNKNIQVRCFGNVFSEEETKQFTIQRTDICQSLDIKED